MASGYTNFARLTTEEKTIWSVKLWQAARDKSLISKYMGDSEDSMVQRITELTKSTKGTRAVITLVADMVGDGIAGDRRLKGNEEALQAFDEVIRYDQLRQANTATRMADQASILNFREQSRNRIAYNLAKKVDEMGILTLSGISYTYDNNGALRVGSDLVNLDFAQDVTAPTDKRYLVWDGTNKDFVTNTSNATLTAADTPSWQLFVDARAYLETHYVRPLSTKDGVDFYQVLIHPLAMAKLKKDPDFLTNLRYAGIRGEANELFKGASTVYVDGFAITPHRLVFNTSQAVSGTGKWGSGHTVDGCRMLFCGAQALAFADITSGEWEEEYEDYKNEIGISCGRIFGMKKPKFYSIYDKSVQDFGVLAVDVAM